MEKYSSAAGLESYLEEVLENYLEVDLKEVLQKFREEVPMTSAVHSERKKCLKED